MCVYVCGEDRGGIIRQPAPLPQLQASNATRGGILLMGDPSELSSDVYRVR